jgi:hypothetical protein
MCTKLRLLYLAEIEVLDDRKTCPLVVREPDVATIVAAPQLELEPNHRVAGRDRGGRQVSVRQVI